MILYSKSEKGFRQEFKAIFSNLFTLPRVIRQIVRTFIHTLFYFHPLFAVLYLVHDSILVSLTLYLCTLHTLKYASAWIGWFPVLFYATVYVGELHKRASPIPDPADTTAVRALEAEATRLGSRALLYSSLLSLGANIVLPLFVSEARQRKPALSPLVANRAWFERFQVHLGSLWTVSHLIFALCMGATL